MEQEQKQEQERHLMHWIYVHRAIISLVWQIKSRKLVITNIVAISRGGLIPATFLSHALDVRTIQTIRVRSYDNHGRQSEIGYQHSPTDFATIRDNPSNLIVDDIIDTGKTFEYLKQYFPNSQYCALVSKIPHTAMHAVIAPPSRWVVFPWEAPYTKEMNELREADEE